MDTLQEWTERTIAECMEIVEESHVAREARDARIAEFTNASQEQQARMFALAETLLFGAMTKLGMTDPAVVKEVMDRRMRHE